MADFLMDRTVACVDHFADAGRQHGRQSAVDRYLQAGIAEVVEGDPKAGIPASMQMHLTLPDG